MFPRKNRLRKEWEIKRVFKRGTCLHSPLFSFVYLQNRKTESQATVVVSKKYDKRAVERNRLKRVFREASHHFVLNLKAPTDIIILPKEASRTKSFHEIYSELEKIFEKISCEAVK